MLHLILAVAAFLASHLIPAVPALRGRLIGLLGWRGYLMAYSTLSLAILAWVGLAYVRAPYVEVWPYDPALRWVPVLVMPVASVLLVAGLVRPNPLSVSLWRARRHDDEPGAPGLFGVIRHPVPWAFALWAAAHLAPNGDVASIILFGLLLALSVGGAHGLDAKRRRVLGAEAWRRLAQRRFHLDGREGVGVAGGLALYAVLAGLHEPVIGISPWPPALMGLILGG